MLGNNFELQNMATNYKRKYLYWLNWAQVLTAVVMVETTWLLALYL